MIAIKRASKPPRLAETHKAFKSAIVGKDAKAAYDFYQENTTTYKYNTEETKKRFKKMNHKHCSFCTKYISDFDKEMTVEHIKGKRACPELIFQWTNLLCSCKTCNTDRSTKPYKRKKYLDPTKIEDIEKYFLFELDGSIRVNEELEEEEQQKAKYMIEMYGLDREELECDRRNFMKKLMEDEEYYKCLKKDELSSQNIIFLSVFTYYRRCME